MVRKKIVLDADVIINFSKVRKLYQLARFLPNYDFIVLDIVYNEINNSVRIELDNIINSFKEISLITFPQDANMMNEYAQLTRNFGKGESACMSYCRFTSNVVGSSNFKDIRDYCSENNILYVGTVDFLYYGIKNGVINEKDAESLLYSMINQGAKLPSFFDYSTHIPFAIL